jgi:hypothetical protein
MSFENNIMNDAGLYKRRISLFLYFIKGKHIAAFCFVKFCIYQEQENDPC